MPETPFRDRDRLRRLRDTGVQFVFWRDGGHALCVIELAPGRAVTVGRGPDNDIVFAHDAVSKRHLTLAVGSHGAWQITDRSSTNGTYIGPGTTDDEPANPLTTFTKLERGSTKLLSELHTLVRLGRRGPCFHVQLVDDGRDTITESDFLGPRVLDRLTARQLEVLIALCAPKFGDVHARTTPNRELGEAVNLSLEGVKTAIVSLRTLYGAKDRETLAALALREGLADVAAARE